MIDFWNERYSKTEFAYGEQPNEFLKTELAKISIGKILFPAEGEGRNAVHAAKKGWEVDAFDQSIEGQKKATLLAHKNNVKINYSTEPFEKLNYKNEYFDAIGLIYAHFPSDQKSHYHQIISNYLKPGGFIIFEAFSKKHLHYNSINPKVGGPKDIDMLFSVEEIKADFKNFEILILQEEEITLSEGILHNGRGSVVRFVGKKL